METLCCNSCGGPLNVSEGTKFLKCNHCGQQLAVRRSDTATFTEAVDRLTATTESLSEQVEELSRLNRLAELDRQWEQKRENFLITDKNGRSHLPDEGSSLMGGVVILLFGCFWTAMAIGITSSGPNHGPFAIAKFAFPAFGVLFVVFGVISAVRHYQKAQDYRADHRRYQAERARLLDEEP